MSILDVHNAILDTFQKNAAIDAEFSTALTGTVTSSGTGVTGVGSAFTTEVAVGDYIGNPTKGYRKVTAITDDTHITVKSAFDTALAAEAIKKTEIKKGVPDDLQISTRGKMLRVGFLSSASRGVDCPNTVVRVAYGFILIVGFKESDPDEAEDVKSQLEKALGDCVDTNPTFNLAKVEGVTELGQMRISQNPQVEGEYIGAASLIVTRQERRGAR